MDTWLIFTIIIFGSFLFLTSILWMDWRFKCRKSAKDNRLLVYLPCFIAVRNGIRTNGIVIMDGIFGVNKTHIVFANRFKDDALYVSRDISSISNFALSNYDENEFSEFANKCLNGENERITYYITSMAGLGTSKRIPKSLTKRMMCKLSFANIICKISVKGRGAKNVEIEPVENIFSDGEYCFFIKKTKKNTEIFMKLQDCIQIAN